jgi:hypothetical protein
MQRVASRRRSLIAERWPWKAFAFLLTVTCGAAAVAQDVTEPSLKAAFIYNFAKFTTWPADVLSSTESVLACVIGDEQISNALARAVKGRLLLGRPLTVSHLTPADPLGSCRLLYVTNVTTPQATQIMTAIRSLPVLTISDTAEFIALGAIARIFVEDGKMRFDLDYGIAKRSRLQLSSKLLSLANRVRDEPNGAAR